MFKINELIILSGNILSLDSVCRVFLFSYSCGWFSSFACPSVFLLTICVSCCQLAFVQQRGLRQSRGKLKKKKKKKKKGGGGGCTR